MAGKHVVLDGTPTQGPYVVSMEGIRYDEYGHYMEGILIKDAADTTAIAEICGALPPLEAVGNANLFATAASAAHAMNPSHPLRAARAIKAIVQAAREIVAEGHELDGADRRVSQERVEDLDRALAAAGIEVGLPIRT